MNSRLLVALLSVGLIGCAATGVRVDESQLSHFQKGKTTYAEVVAALGQPTTTSVLSDGRRLALYSYAEAQARPETFIPIIGPLVGGADTRSSMVSFQFDEAGILQSYSSSQSQYGSAMGFSSGASPADRVTAQPR